MSFQRKLQRGKLQRETRRKGFGWTWMNFQRKKYGWLYYRICELPQIIGRRWK